MPELANHDFFKFGSRAEKKLIHLITYDAAPEKIARAQKTVNRWTSAWRRSCEKASASHRETVVR